MKFKADLTDTVGRLKLIEIEFTGKIKITDCELRQIITKELPGWRLLSWWV
ncbi:hypothetical protein [Nostoc sp. PA-18-2419]|uniref:hypothetical protein n=1 Tax=Nostoc sp. PA-18-2419 TaxID=2575443 RepID=UPI00167ADD1D|nr:hypothetical protein [Nostoc sp. PA-18-2419]